MRQPLESRSPAEAPQAPRMGDFAGESQLSSVLGTTDVSLVEGLTVATFLYARLHNFTAVANALGPDEAASFVNEVRRMLTEPVLKLGGEVAQRRPDSILAVFSNKHDDRKPNHAQRGLHAAILAVHEAVQLAQVVASKPQLAGLPALTLAAGVHLGQAELSRRNNGGNVKVHAIGDAVEVARLLEVTAMDLNWSVATSAGTRLAAAGRADGGRIGSVGLPDNTFIDIVEVTGLVPRKGSQTPARVFEMLREGLQVNAQARKRQSAAPAPAASLSGAQFLVEGYRILRKIGEGGMASIFLAQSAEGGPPQVLKVMQLDRAVEADGLQRFIQEYALLAQIQHPNVARIFRQDFSVAHAYIAMEYFPQGDLRACMKAGPIDQATAISYLKQTAAGLAAIHEVGIVHRDLKPDNLMLRNDGSLALADFGVAKQTAMKITDTGDGDIVGTPYYLSPEQALGQGVDARCDIYSLGVLAFELLTGRKPYHANSAQELLRMHVHEPVPLLPPEHAHLQAVMESMMAKDREQRYPSARTLLDDLAQMGL
ncbi:protein kinase [Ramlibacter sp. USB13]|uniref:Protein kinase n=1 Tax=Ramlibacter cellulosilyticus TaxID=2764187 RepID=A0A923SA66_9BURK|nr:protein kinase [Ramlibacter cellulosilyticus]MBC5782439.1 protein kinase [Ramlibacter cellulosilyticus]